MTSTNSLCKDGVIKIETKTSNHSIIVISKSKVVKRINTLIVSAVVFHDSNTKFSIGLFH